MPEATTTTIQPLTIANALPAQLVVLTAEVLVLCDQLLAEAQQLQVTDEVTFQRADRHAKKIGALFRDVEEERLRLSRACKAVQDQVNGAAGEALLPLKLGWDELVARIKKWQTEENARRAEEARRIREEQEAKQREEEARAAAEAEAKRQAALDDLPPGVEPDAAAVPPVTESLPQRIAPSAPIPKPLKASSYSNRKEPELEIFDESLIPFQVDGMRLWKEPSKSTIKTLLKAGKDVPGCRLVENDGVTMRGR